MTNMRKSLATSHDVLSGEIKTYEKLKPMDSYAKGVHTIQLFNKETGNLEKEVISENFIGIAWDDIQKLVAKAVFLGQFMNYNAYNGFAVHNDQYSGALLNRMNNFEKFMGHPFNRSRSFHMPFRYMLLTNDVDVESPLTERLAKGTVIGYSERETNYSGADLKKGSFNSAESVVTEKHIKFVWDFPTHASNGVISSLVWNESIDKNNLAHVPTGEFNLVAPDGYEFNNGYRGSALKGNNLYVMVKPLTNNRYAVAKYQIDKTTYVATFVSVTLMEDRFNNSNYGSRGIEVIESSEIIYITLAGYNETHCFNINTGIRKIGFPSNAESLTNTTGVFEKDGVLYYGFNGGVIAKVISNWAEYQPTAIPQGTTGNFFGADLVEGLGVALKYGGDNAYFYDDLVNGFKKTVNCPFDLEDTDQSSANVNNVSRNQNGKIAMYVNRDLPTPSNTLKVYEFEIGRIGGRNLLPEPITKTADYTMKVTYDLYFE